LKKSLRESFRRLRKGRSQRNKKKSEPTTTTDPIKRELPRSESPETRPVERQIEARAGSEDGLGSMVRCLYFSQTFIVNQVSPSPTIWAGTNSGQVLVFVLEIPEGEEKRKEDKVGVTLGKEIQLKHRAPVLGIQILDASCVPVTSTSQSDIGGAHKVLIASEEQFKMFMLPALKPCGKYKLTAHEGARIRKIGFTTFVSKVDRNYSENCLTCLTNQGDLVVHSLPDLRRQDAPMKCTQKEDVIGISTMTFTPNGEAFYMASSSEMARVSIAAAYNIQPTGTLTPINRHVIKDGKAAKKSEAAAALPAPSKKKSTDDAEAAAVARQNQLNEQQAQGNKSPVANGDPHNETTVSEISADITIDSVKDHTMAQTPMTSTTSRSSIKPPSVIVEESVDEKVEESVPAASPPEQVAESNGVNGSTEE